MSRSRGLVDGNCVKPRKSKARSIEDKKRGKKWFGFTSGEHSHGSRDQVKTPFDKETGKGDYIKYGWGQRFKNYNGPLNLKSYRKRYGKEMDEYGSWKRL